LNNTVRILIVPRYRYRDGFFRAYFELLTKSHLRN
jgi:hypothetical protein